MPTAVHEFQDAQAAPRAAYIHVPFCARRCGYCSFTVVTGRDDLVPKYLAGLERELAALETPRPVDTLFIGGGTPTRLAPDALEELLSTVVRWFPLAAGGEFTVEANPGDPDADRVAVLARHGVTRVSLGAQSFNPAKLRVLERDHQAADIARAVELLRPHVHSVSLDLIFAAPGETLDQWQADLAATLALRPDHVSTYGLTYERGTTFWNRRQRGELANLDEELERSMYAAAIDALAAAGFEHYEVSNFARQTIDRSIASSKIPSPLGRGQSEGQEGCETTLRWPVGHRCRHNEVYWAGEEYYAAGPGAARYVEGRREMNHRSTTTWLARVLEGKSPVAETEVLSPEDRAREMLVFALRRLEGISRSDFTARSGFEIDELVGPELRRCVEMGLLSDDGRRVRLTCEGLFVSDAIWPQFLRR
jgi:coproporphyrinogen III oxidase-like Fe-S oxidoreductase